MSKLHDVWVPTRLSVAACKAKFKDHDCSACRDVVSVLCNVSADSTGWTDPDAKPLATNGRFMKAKKPPPTPARSVYDALQLFRKIMRQAVFFRLGSQSGSVQIGKFVWLCQTTRRLFPLASSLSLSSLPLMPDSARGTKRKNTEVQKVQSGIVDMVAGFSPSVRNRWFAYKPNSSSSKEQENFSPLPSPEKPAKRDNASKKRDGASIDRDTMPDSDTIDLSNETDSESDASSPLPRRKKSKSSASDDEADEAIEMSFCIEVETPAPPVLTVRKTNTKPIPPKTTTLGPYEFTSSISYTEFLALVAKGCRTSSGNLVCDAMEWKFDRPANSKRRPLRDEVGLKVAIKALTERRKDFNFSIYMPPPTPVKQELVLPFPWLKTESEKTGPLDFDFTPDELTASGSVISVREQIAGIDAASNPHFNILLERYPIDNNPLFPGKRIYHNEVGFHELSDIKLRVWAVAMAKGAATKDKPPSSSHFNKNQTIRISNAPPAAAIPVPLPAPPAAGDGLLQLLALLPAIQTLTHQQPPPPYGFPPNPYYPHQYPPNFPPAHAPAAPAATLHPESPPPIVLPRTIILDEYCERYQLNADDRRVLTALGYEPGDDGIKALGKEEWDEAKVAPLAKGRILRQHGAFLKDVVAGLWD
ncbi:hypothetical protein DFH06DRAFT_1143097 [Mycena polygramma]|nr:hypothetical protein DFH06DRAFT_1143097 [Mycena polygramma]